MYILYIYIYIIYTLININTIFGFEAQQLIDELLINCHVETCVKVHVNNEFKLH